MEIFSVFILFLEISFGISMDNPRSAKTIKIEKSERIIAYCPKKEIPSLEERIDRTIKGVSALMTTEKIEARVLVLKFEILHPFSLKIININKFCVKKNQKKLTSFPGIIRTKN